MFRYNNADMEISSDDSDKKDSDKWSSDKESCDGNNSNEED